MRASFVFTHFEKSADHGIAKIGCAPALEPSSGLLRGSEQLRCDNQEWECEDLQILVDSGEELEE